VIDPKLFVQPMALDRVQHRTLRLKPRGIRFDRTAGMNALFITAVEFSDVCRDYPIVFVEAGQGPDGQREVAPMLRSYPLAIAPVDGTNYAVCFDAQADAVSTEEGERLFDDAGEPTKFMAERRQFLEEIEREVQRTRLVGRRLLELGLLRSMRFDATLPDGSKLSVDGFLAVDEEKLASLPEATVFDLHRTGVLSLIHAQQISLGLMRALVERRLALRAAA
jgi:hypothetical protein